MIVDVRKINHTIIYNIICGFKTKFTYYYYYRLGLLIVHRAYLAYLGSPSMAQNENTNCASEHGATLTDGQSLDDCSRPSTQVHSVTFPDGQTLEIVVDADANICFTSELIDTVDQTGRRKRKQPEFWKKNVRKKSRESGQEYVTQKGKTQMARAIKFNPCIGRKCQNRCGKEWTEESRLKKFQYFWKLDHQSQRDWIIAHTMKAPVRKMTNPNKPSRRASTIKYFMENDESRRIPVCKQFFLNTLNIGSRLISYTILNNVDNFKAKVDARGMNIPHNITKGEVKMNVRAFISSLPAVPSHYCRSTSNRKYLPVEMQNLTNVYRTYKLETMKKGQICASEQVFKGIFRQEYNIGFHCPKKDKCTTCEQFRNTPLQLKTLAIKEKQAAHITEKEATYKQHSTDQNRCENEKDVLCASFDLEKVLTTPHGDSMLLFYARKYAYYNLSVYESKTRRGYCYLWGESDGNRGACEIASCMMEWLDEVDKRQTVRKLILYCDCCSGQNRNKIMIGMLQAAVNRLQSIEEITLKFLLTGHTYMPADSIHATIEHFIHKRMILAPSEWPTAIRMARTNPEPYTVKEMTYKSFRDWKRSNVIPDRVVDQDNVPIKWKAIRSVRFVKGADAMEVTYSLQDDARTHYASLTSRRPRRKDSSLTSATEEICIQMYNQKLPISHAKYTDLKQLCMSGVIPTHFHDQYLSLPYELALRDCLPDSDVEDQDPDDVDEQVRIIRYNYNKLLFYNKGSCIKDVRTEGDNIITSYYFITKYYFSQLHYCDHSTYR